ncbi:hypothetical protein HKX48_002862 [Thoreauomyces humboldtii]|nr:hypothetical protein HKX48_002862 [Thoreauomyces humboldtii]
MGLIRKGKKQQAAKLRQPPADRPLDTNTSLVLKFAMVAPVLVFVDQGGVRSIVRTLYQLGCAALLYIIFGPIRTGPRVDSDEHQRALLPKRQQHQSVLSGDGGVFWKAPPGEKTIPAPPPSPKDGKKIVFGKTPLDPVIPDAAEMPAILEPAVSIPQKVAYPAPQPPTIAREVKPVVAATVGAFVAPASNAPKEPSQAVKPVQLPTPVSSPLLSRSSATPSPASTSTNPTAVYSESDASRLSDPPSPVVSARDLGTLTSVPRSVQQQAPTSPRDATPTSPTPSAASSTSHASLPAKYTGEIEMMVKTLQHLASDSTQWSEAGGKRGPEEPVTYSVSSHKVIEEAWKFEAEMRSTVESAFRYLIDPDTRQVWDPLTESQTVLRRFTALDQETTTRIQYSRTKGVFPSIPRDMVVLFHGRRLGTDRAIVVQRGVEWNGEGVVQDNSGIKVDVNMCGSVIEKLPDQADGTPRIRITHVHDVNYHMQLTTPVSQFMVTMIAPQAIRRLAAALEDQHMSNAVHDDIINVYGSSDDAEEIEEQPQGVFGGASQHAGWRSSKPPRISLQASVPFNEMVSPLVLPAQTDLPAPEEEDLEKSVLAPSMLSDDPTSPSASSKTHTELVERMVLESMAQLDRRAHGWHPLISATTADCKVFESKNHGARFGFKVVASDLRGDVQTVASVLADMEGRRRWDPAAASGTAALVGTLDPTTKMYNLFPSTLAPSGRTETVVVHTRSFDSGSVLVVFSATPRDDEAQTTVIPDAPGSLSAAFVERHSTDPERSVLTHLLPHPDPTAPATARYVAARAMPVAVARLREVVASKIKVAAAGAASPAASQ